MRFSKQSSTVRYISAVAAVLLLTVLIPSIAAAASVTLAWDWTQTTRTPTNFFMYRQNGCAGIFTKVGSIAWPSKQFVDGAVTFGGLYCWYVTAYDSLEQEESVPSSTVRFQVPKEPLAVPSGLRVVTP